MFCHLGNGLIIAVLLFNIFHLLTAKNVGLLITCTTQQVNLKYSKPLSAAAGGPVTVTATDSGVWSPCTVARIPTNVTYYLSVILSQANCQQANFTKLLFKGFFTVLSLPTSKLVNFTVDLSDPTHTRQLNVPQAFNGSLSTPVGVTLFPPANITFTFNATNHQKNCQQISSEQVAVDPNVYLLSTHGTINNLISFHRPAK